MALNARGVRVDVYARPGNQQPESLRYHYSEVEAALCRTGAQLHPRSGMHEKIGIIDGRILWHGSLNILSHNNTRESMLRFDSTELVQEVLKELRLGSELTFSEVPAKEEVSEPTPRDGRVTSFPTCPVCSGRMLPFEDAGRWICENSPKCSGNLPATGLSALQKEMNTLLPEVKIQCPVCDAAMQISKGVFLRIACSSAECSFSLDPRIASSLLRVLKRRGVA